MTASEALSELRKEFVRRGWYQKATGRILMELLVNLGLAGGGIVLFLATHSLLIKILAAVVCIMGSIGVGTNTHTSSHYATSERRWLNELLTYLGYPVFLGLSATLWWHKHIVVHHPAPNVIGVDTDADLSPWFALTEEEVARSGGVRQFYYRHLQFWVFPIALALNGFNMHKAGWNHILTHLWNSQRRRKKHWIDLASMLLHYAIWIIIPACFFPLSRVLIFYAVWVGLMGYAMYAVLGPGHIPSDAVRVRKEQRNADHLLLQTATTINFRTGWIGRLICAGLEYQIEHHLFPNVSHVFYPQISKLVKAFCRENDLPYRSYSWAEALWKTWSVLRIPARIDTDLKRLDAAARY